jgi:hypothetical protein
MPTYGVFSNTVLYTGEIIFSDILSQNIFNAGTTLAKSNILIECSDLITSTGGCVFD